MKHTLQAIVAGGCKCMSEGTREKSQIMPLSTASSSAGMRAMGQVAGDSFAARKSKRWTSQSSLRWMVAMGERLGLVRVVMIALGPSSREPTQHEK